MLDNRGMIPAFLFLLNPTLSNSCVVYCITRTHTLFFPSGLCLGSAGLFYALFSSIFLYPCASSSYPSNRCSFGLINRKQLKYGLWLPILLDRVSKNKKERG